MRAGNLVRLLIAVLVCGALVTGVVIWRGQSDPGDPRLAPFVRSRPPVPIVFTSRSEGASFLPAAPDGAEYFYPGKRLWQARQGRLRLLRPDGSVHELTWGRALPDGSTLIDVMGPAVTHNGRKIIFAGRKGGDDPGHFRLYEVGIDGRGLRPLTGGADDEGCTAVPPMRYPSAEKQEKLPDSERRRIDYDDVDPVPLPGGHLIFVSSRVPDLGRDHARRATHLWFRHADGRLRPMTSNRNNDRWPFFTATGVVIFSHWSRNREVITADRRDIVPWEPGMAAATEPTDHWAAMMIQTDGDRFSHIAKAPIPVWRPRMLFNGRLVCMTRLDGHLGDESGSGLRLVQIEPGLIARVPSAMAAGSRLPAQQDEPFVLGPTHDEQGRALDLATPSPCPDRRVVFAARPADANGPASAGDWGIWLADEDWSMAGSSDSPVSTPHDFSGPPPRQVHLTLLFDDPELVEAEPVAVYTRPEFELQTEMPLMEMVPDQVELADGSVRSGPATYLENGGVYVQQNEEAPGQTTDRGEGPIFAPAPAGLMETIRIYAAERDRFDDPDEPRVEGQWRLLLESRLDEIGQLRQWVPLGTPTVLAGFDRAGRVAEWTTPARDSQGRQASFFAFAGDHYSGGQPAAFGFCLGCHPGHSGIGYQKASDVHRERLR